ncbi:MAG TPA: lycopene cyclase family protein [Saprospiraceae bacterium]|nr:lycopene cyclase family protein [Saprospiraceae bacterium]
MQTHYDYIVSGGGAAGLSWVHRLLHSSLKDRRVLILEPDTKDRNDRTWCFWEREPGPFEHIVHHQWRRLWFHQGDFSRLLDINPYVYKVIRGIDFYKELKAVLAGFPNVEWRHELVEELRNTGAGVEVKAGGWLYSADWCINSVYRGPAPDKQKLNYLDQHFRGWFVRAESDVFDPGVATMMDFRTPQEGEFRFLYVLPFSTKEALVEVAIFSNQHLEAAGYDEILARYMREHLPQAGGYEVTETEQGNIPMTDFDFPRQEGRIVNIGMAGGDTRASTGYTFWNIQQRVDGMVRQLEQQGRMTDDEPWARRRSRRYDTLMLHVLERGLHPGDELFRQLFERNPSPRLLAFLNAETTLPQELALMSTTPIGKFLAALAGEMRR